MTSGAIPRAHRRSAGGVCALACVLAAVSGGLVLPAAARAQLAIQDFVVTAGASGEGYQGNLPSVGVPVQDSTEFASAAIGEVAVRSDLTYAIPEHGRIALAFDGGLRQFSARGFELRDYSPREWAGTLDLSYARPLGAGAGVTVRTRLRGRQIDDRPPMPLYLQPGYRSATAALRFDVEGPRQVFYDLEAFGERSEFLAPDFAPQIRLLDRNAHGIEAGATLTGGSANLRIYGGLERSRYPRQETFDPDDPVREDMTFLGGASWTYQADYIVQIELDGRANRSNSDRPEYDALTFRAVLSASLPRQVALNVYGALTAKQYLHSTEFARLLPGEEANSASQAYVSLTRSVARNLDATIRGGWTRAETEIGGAYFQRFGASFYLHYRPGF
ncbi:MAG: hypothetical protein WD013_03785 [Gemmatimonadota bacterium]